MDIAHNKISQELPFDAVANQINSSITSYKDGKDQHLVNGTTDIAMKKSIVEEFYTKLKKDLLTSSRENEIKSNGTEIGRFVVNNTNDIVERSLESFGSESGVVLPTMKLMLHNQVMPVCAMVIKLGKNVRDITKKGFTKSLPKVSVPSNIDSYKNTYLKSVIENVLGDKLVDVNFSSLQEYLRDTINLFSKNRDDTTEYMKRYIKRYSDISDIVSDIAISVNDMLTGFQKAFDNASVGLETTDIEKQIGAMEVAANRIAEKYNKLLDYNTTEDNDFFTFVNQKYKIDAITFAAKRSEFMDNTYDGLTKLDVVNYVKNLHKFDVTENNTRIIFSTIKSLKGVNKITDEMKAYYGNLNTETLADKQKREFYQVLDDMTVGDFYSQVDKFNKYTKDFKSDADECISKLIESTTRVANITGTLCTYTLNKIATFSNLSDPANYKLASLALSVASWACSDLMTVVNALHYINANDLVMKLYLYENTVNFVKYIDDCIQSWRKQND